MRITFAVITGRTDDELAAMVGHGQTVLVDDQTVTGTVVAAVMGADPPVAEITVDVPITAIPVDGTVRIGPLT